MQSTSSSMNCDNQENRTPAPATSSKNGFNVEEAAQPSRREAQTPEPYVDVVTVDNFLESPVREPASWSDEFGQSSHSLVESQIPLTSAIFNNCAQPSDSQSFHRTSDTGTDAVPDNAVEPLPETFLQTYYHANGNPYTVTSINTEIQTRCNRALTTRNTELQMRVQAQKQIINDQKKKIADLRAKIHTLMNGRPRKSINAAVCKATKRVHLKNFYDSNGITVREAFNILPNKLSVEEDAAITTAVGISQPKRRQLKKLLRKHGCDVLAPNNNVEALLSAQNAIDGVDKGETSNGIVPDANFESSSDEDDRDSEMFDDFVVDVEEDDYTALS